MNARRAKERTREEQQLFDAQVAEEMRRGDMRRRLLLLVTIAAVAALLIVALVGISRQETSTPDAAREQLRAVPQQGVVLGDANAPLTLTETADLQCPFCATFSDQAMPAIIDRYVKTGKVKIKLNVIAFLGSDSERAARAAYAAARQNKMYDFVQAFYARQGRENSGYVTDEWLRELASAIPGLDVERMMRDRTSSEVTAAMHRAEQDADRLKVTGTPAFHAGEGSDRKTLRPRALTSDEFVKLIEEQLQR